jgi:hypothetical protein
MWLIIAVIGITISLFCSLNRKTRVAPPQQGRYHPPILVVGVLLGVLIFFVGCLESREETIRSNPELYKLVTTATAREATFVSKQATAASEYATIWANRNIRATTTAEQATIEAGRD